MITWLKWSSSFPFNKETGENFYYRARTGWAIRFIPFLVTAKCLVCHDDLLNYVLVHFPTPFFFSLFSLCCKYVVVLIGWFCLLKLLFDITLVSYHLFLFYLFCSPDGICMWSNLVCIFFFVSKRIIC